MCHAKKKNAVRATCNKHLFLQIMRRQRTPIDDDDDDNDDDDVNVDLTIDVESSHDDNGDGDDDTTRLSDEHERANIAAEGGPISFYS
jgi:hypothetical protein